MQQRAAVTPVDIPTGWDPQAKQQPTGLLLTLSLARQRRLVLVPLDTLPKEKSAVAMQQRIFGGVPSGTRTHGLQIHNLAR